MQIDPRGAGRCAPPRRIRRGASGGHPGRRSCRAPGLLAFAALACLPWPSLADEHDLPATPPAPAADAGRWNFDINAVPLLADGDCPGADAALCDVGLDAPGWDRRGLRRDSLYFVGYQVVTIGVLYVMPESVSGWSDEQREDYSLSEWWDNVRNPTWDKDDYVLNYVLHPYWGAAYYVRGRERGLAGGQAFWYSAGMSALYEFGAEALFEQPSIQDLIVTPVGGALVGGWFMNMRERIRVRAGRRGHRTTGESWVWVLTDPLGAINGKVDGWLGRDASFRMAPYYDVARIRVAGDDALVRDRRYGLAFEIRW